MILHDVSHTSHCSANSGIQQVVRKMQSSVAKQTEILPDCVDPYAGFWRVLDLGEAQLISSDGLTSFRGKRNSHWSYAKKLKGLALGYFSQGLKQRDIGEASFLTGEIFNPLVHAQYAALFPRLQGPRVAVFHDAIALRLPEYTPKNTCRRIPVYMMELLDFDGVAAVSQASADDLKAFWGSRAVPARNQPMVRVIPNACSPASHDNVRTGDASREVLMVSTIEGRKNHVGLLKAAKILWDENQDFNLKIIGGLNPETGSEAHQMILDLKGKGYPLAWDGSVNGEELIRAYQNCRFTVYPSFWEGFGLPVLESLSFGKPCVCTSFGALIEVAESGGCLLLKDGAPESIADGMRKLLVNEAELELLEKEAGDRSYRSWDEHADEMLEFIEELKVDAPRLSA